ncbi:MAG: selenocysteine-specific translation elongation factor [Gemmatimonadetes bacterium]|nr:selenocysteine-specific translation elongation factor [Gemmatimonadota bacterium]
MAVHCARSRCGKSSDGNDAFRMILGTAGHIDHGKTTLVRALTGVDTDRLPEERRRGITIDLGFAPLQLEGIGQVGVVDVPGHDAFVRTMVAGATGIDVALVVIAADAGVMPQTREHLAILGLLGVDVGVVALTKCDLVDDEWRALVEDDVHATLDASSLAGARVIPVSSTTGAGLPELRRALADAARRVPPHQDADLFRLPVDRAFTIRGTGTVVTGTVWSGSLTRDATVRMFPADVVVRVRSIQAHGAVVERVRAGDRAALALVGIDVDDVGRGTVLVQGDGWRPSRVLRGDITLLPECARALGPRSRVRLHLGTSDVGARIVVRGDSLRAGDQRAARIVLDAPLVTRAGDRFVLRAASPMTTIGGGIVTDPHAPDRARPWDTPATDVLSRVTSEAGAAGVLATDLPVRLGVSPRAAEGLVATSNAWRVGERLFDAGTHESLRDAALAMIDAYHAQHSLEAGAPMQWLRSRLGVPDDVASAVLAALAADEHVRVEQGVVSREHFQVTLSREQAALRDAIMAVLESADAEPPTIDELASTLGVDLSRVEGIARWLQREGALVAVETNRYYSRSTVQRLVALMAKATAEQEATPAQLREIIGSSRKYLIPFLEYCDRMGYTLRTGHGRRFSAP